MLLLAACHRNNKSQQADSVSVEPPPQTTGDTVSPKAPDTASSQQRTAQQLRQDTAEITNLRIFARKQSTIYGSELRGGEWQRGSEHEQYMSDGSGRYWDTSDDVSREEAQDFRWTMDSNLLLFECRMKLGGLMYRRYVVTFVDDETLVYRDAYGGSYMWDKVPAGFTDRPKAKEMP